VAAVEHPFIQYILLPNRALMQSEAIAREVLLSRHANQALIVGCGPMV